MTDCSDIQPLWWERADLQFRANTLFLGQQNLLALAQSAGTPVFAYSARRVKTNLRRLLGALEKREVRAKIFYALKANRYLPLITYLKLTGLCGIDVCSPGELRLARQVGFREDEITYTNTSVSDEDLEVLQRHPKVRINCDSISTLKRLGQRCSGRTIGIRINPQLGAGYHQQLQYAGSKPTKFGIYQDRFLEALDIAKSYNLRVKTLHFHCGSGYLSPQIKIVDEILERAAWFLEQCPDIDTLDMGGGLGVPLVEGDQLLDLERWGEVVAEHARRRNLEIHLEPGDYLVKDAGVLLLQINSVEEKGGVIFVGVNGGFNLQNLAVYYHIPFIITPVVRRNGPTQQVTIAGNINEAIDLFAQDILLPPLAEGDYLALLNAGGYGSAMSSNHCMRGQFAEYLLLDE